MGEFAVDTDRKTLKLMRKESMRWDEARRYWVHSRQPLLLVLQFLHPCPAHSAHRRTNDTGWTSTRATTYFVPRPSGAARWKLWMLVRLLRSRSHSSTVGLIVPGVGYRTVRDSGNIPLSVRPPGGDKGVSEYKKLILLYKFEILLPSSPLNEYKWDSFQCLITLARDTWRAQHTHSTHQIV